MPVTDCRKKAIAAVSLLALSYVAEEDNFARFREWAIRLAAGSGDQFTMGWLKTMKPEFLPALGSMLAEEAWPGQVFTEGEEDDD